MKFITIINDCKSQNDIGRQLTRYSLLFPSININFVGIGSSLGKESTLEAAGNLIDMLDASEGKEGIITLNVAPRGQIKEDGENGSKFSYFWYKKTLVVSTIKGYNLSLVKKLKLAKSINIMDTKEVLDFVAKEKIIERNLASYIENSQFRSFDFQPRVAKWLSGGIILPHKVLPVSEIKDVPSAIWLIDSFGNAKTTIIREELNLNKDAPVHSNFGELNYYERLKLIPDGETAIYTGSSGIQNKRFLEIATQNREGSAAKKLKLKIGDTIEIK